jgi:3D (Asp-Asp-Asp) domain-containing protein
MYVPGYGRGVAADTGGGVRNYLIDLGFEDDTYEHWHGWRDVYLIEPLPPEDQIRWVLP